jgi:hypothetical protein
VPILGEAFNPNCMAFAFSVAVPVLVTHASNSNAVGDTSMKLLKE